jgi:hypothetical protein
LVKLSEFNHGIEMRIVMVKKLLSLVVLLMVFLAACQSAAGIPTTPPPANLDPQEAPPVTAASPTAQTVPTATQDEASDQIEIPQEANCTVVSRQPTPGPTEQSIVPAVSDSDWTHGPENADVTIIEYGDFQ